VQHEIVDLDRKGLRQFAFTIAITVCLLFGLALPWLFERGYPRWPWIFGAIFAAWGIVAPQTLRYVYRGWMWFGLQLSKVTTPIVLGAVFFLAVLPIGFARRSFAGDAMARTFDRDAASYRVRSEARAKQNLERPY
jgi:hypothetical protein